jgi:VCBS repeat protein/centrosomal CEP192-like protein
MKPTFSSPSSKSLIRSVLATAWWASIVIAVALAVFPATAFSQVPPPVDFVSGQLFSGVGHGDRIPGAANVYTFAVGDFNNDKKLDLVTVNNSNVWGLGLILGNGDGKFQPPIEVVGNDTYGAFGGIVAGDFNKDGNLDFAVLWLVGHGPVQLGVYLNDGTGHFTPNNNYVIGVSSVHLARSLATADLNGDGKLDLIVPDVSNSTVAVLYGNGNGTFQNAVGIATPYTSTGVAIGDFNKDGKPDIVAAASSGCCPWSGGITVLLNNSNGTFQSPVLYADPSGVDNGLVAVADLNADGKLDVVVSSEGGSNVAVFLGNGDGTFQPATAYPVPLASAIALGDLSGAKKPDIVATSYADGTVWVLLNKGTGIFQTSSVYSADSSAMAMVNGMAIALADFNGDKKPDFVAGNPAGQFVTVGLGNGDGTFRDSPHYNESGVWAKGIAVADFNRDGNLDLVEAGGGTGVGLSLMLGTSHGVFKAPTFIDLWVWGNGPVTFVRALDVNGDGKPDIVCENSKGVVVLLGLGTGKFKVPVTYPASPTSYPVLSFMADLNGDGKLDIVTSNQDGTMSVLLNKGSGTFGTATVFASGTGAYPSAFVLGDFNGDGKVDIVVGDFPAANLKLLMGNGNGTLQSPITLSSPVRPGDVIAADFNKDGKLDLAIPSNDYSGSLAILLGNGNGTFTSGNVYEWFDDSGCTTLPCAHYPESMVAVDLNGDNNLDLVIAPRNPWYLTCGGYRCAEQYLGAVVFLGKGDGTFVGQFGWLAGISPWWVEAGDFNSDGMPDLAFLSSDTNYGLTSVTILQNATQSVSVSPLSIKFPAKLVGTKSTQTVLLTNNQTTSLHISSIAVGGDNPADFSSKSACGSQLATGVRCTISVTFSPTAIGTRTAMLVITDSVGVQSVQLSGVGK